MGTIKLIVIHPEYFEEVLDRLIGADYSGEVGEQTTVGAQDNMYKFFNRSMMTEYEIEEMEKHRT